MKFMTALESQLLSFPRVEDDSAQAMLKLFDLPAHKLVVTLLAAIDTANFPLITATLAAAYDNHCVEFGDALTDIYARAHARAIGTTVAL